MALTVIVRSGDLTKPASITFDAPRIVVGRSSSCEVSLPDPSVSHRHASIRQRGTDYVVIDEGSTNGTFVGPVRLSPQAPRVLRSGDLVRVGRIWLEVRIEQVPVTIGQKLATRELALHLVASALRAQGQTPRARVLVRKGPDAGRELAIADRAYVVGRGDVDLALEDPDLSRRHVELARRGAELWVRDLGSKNGSLLGGEKLESGKETLWPPELTLSIGQTELTYEDPARSTLLELEAAEDERMRDDDRIDPPSNGAPELPSARPLPAPTTEPARPSSNLEGPRETVSRVAVGIGAFDLLVGVVALAVLGLSLFGLWLLFRS
jgi:pSer/pThr/pTyr-binding forkhead associated (FHA) protein